MPKKRRSPWYSLLSLLLIGSAAGLLLYSFWNMDYDWDFGFLKEFLWQSPQEASEGTSATAPTIFGDLGGPGLLLQGLWGTVWISSVSIVLGSLLGVGVGLLLHLREPVSAMAARFFVNVFRNTPLLVQLYVAYFVIGTAFDLEAETAGVLTLSLFCAAAIGEMVRGQLDHFEKGQLEAAASLGLSPWQTAFHIVLPQTGRRLMPPVVGQFVSLVKDSSLVSVISLMELTKAALNVVSVSFKSFETWFLIAVVYFVLNQVLASSGAWLERHLAKSERSPRAELPA